MIYLTERERNILRERYFFAFEIDSLNGLDTLDFWQNYNWQSRVWATRQTLYTKALRQGNKAGLTRREIEADLKQTIRQFYNEHQATLLNLIMSDRQPKRTRAKAKPRARR